MRADADKPGSSRGAGLSLLDAETLARLAGLRLQVERVVDGALAGLHRSLHHGASVEFSEHKEYAPGDDLRRLDWKALAKLDRPYIRQYEDETELSAYLILDTSASMGYGEPLTKLAFGSVLAGALAFILGRQGDRTGILTYAEEVIDDVPPRSHALHLGAILQTLEALRPAGGTRLAPAVDRLLEVLRRRSLIILISDLFDDDEAAVRILRHLRGRGHQVVLLHLLHADEVRFPFSRVSVFEDLESDDRVLADPIALRRAYLDELGRFCLRVEEACREGKVHYQRVTTEDALDEIVLSILERRWG